ncbi:hypothetical protein JCM9492_17210 [Aquifex pyrophilus]
MREVVINSVKSLFLTPEFLIPWIFFFTVLLVITPLPYVGMVSFYLLLLLVNSTVMHFTEVLKHNESYEIRRVLLPKSSVFSYTLSEAVYLYLVAVLSYLFTKFYIVLGLWWLFYKPYLSKELYIARTFKEGFQSILVLLLFPNGRYAKVGIKWLFVSLPLLLLFTALLLSVAGILLASLVALMFCLLLSNFTLYTLEYVKSLD